MIEIEKLGKKFTTGTQTHWVFKDVSLTVQSGESVVIIGPSGSGKSVFLKVIAGLLPSDEGHVQVHTQNIGMLFQKNALFDSLTVQENLLFPLQERMNVSGTQAQEKVARFLTAVGLKGTETLFPDEISGGMQKRLGIARALIVEPEVILYDEPTAGLDPITSKTIADLILLLRREGGSTLITVTNDMQRAYQIGDRIGLMAHGSLKLGGTPEDVRQSTDPSIRQFIYGLKQGPLTSGLA